MSALRPGPGAGMVLALALLAGPLAAQETAPGEAAMPATPASPAPAPGADDDLELDPLQPDFTIVDLPTTLRLPRHAAAFRVTHRFARPLGQGDLGDLAADLFGLDSAAQIGLDLRFGLFSGTQLGVYRTNDRAIDFFLERDLLGRRRSGFGLALYGSVEGRNNFREQYSPAAGLIVSRKLGARAAVYATPAWVGNSARPGESDQDDTLLLGLGARVRLGSSAYLVGEFVPRLAGFKGVDPAHPGQRTANHVDFGIEERVGGHSFQLNFSNFFATTLATLARGAGSGGDWYLGFNISRKFF